MRLLLLQVHDDTMWWWALRVPHLRSPEARTHSLAVHVFEHLVHTTHTHTYTRMYLPQNIIQLGYTVLFFSVCLCPVHADLFWGQS